MHNRNLNQIKLRLANKDKGSFRAEGNVIWFYDAVASDDDEAMWLGGISPNMFREALEKCDGGPVRMRFNSPGGSVFGAQAMVAAMREYPGEITAQIDSLAASAASVLAANCARTVMVPGAMIMIHNAWTMAMGDKHDLRKDAELLEQIDGEIEGAYRRKAGDKTDWAADMNKESWYGSSAALANGLSDETLEASTQRAQNKWDLSAFKNTPKKVEDLKPENGDDQKLISGETWENAEEPDATDIIIETPTVEVKSPEPEVDAEAQKQIAIMAERRRRVELIEKGL